jgi:hypothetical protein
MLLIILILPDVPVQDDVCIHVPDPCGVLHDAFVQHLISDDPGHKPLVIVP